MVNYSKYKNIFPLLINYLVNSYRNTFCNHSKALEKEYDLNSKTILFEKQPNECLYLDTVDYSYLFQIKLPENLPSSFSPSGKIRYSFKAILDAPKTFNQYAVKPFTVISQGDQNQINPSLKETYKSTESLLCFSKCNTKTIKL